MRIELGWWVKAILTALLIGVIVGIIAYVILLIIDSFTKVPNPEGIAALIGLVAGLLALVKKL